MHKFRRAAGFTVLEVLVTMAVLVFLGAAIMPSFSAFYGNTRQQAAADLVRARMADARARAMRDTQVYRLAIHQDGKRIRVAPDGPDFGDQAPDHAAGPTSKVSEDQIDKATASLLEDPDGHTMGTESASWKTVATFLPDGTCREDNAVVEVMDHDGKYPPIQVRLRGLTGAVRVVKVTKNKGQQP